MAVRLVGAGGRAAALHPAGEPIQNAFVASFIGRFRDECLNQHWFGPLAEAARVIEAWRQHYNRERPLSALGYEPPEQFVHRPGALAPLASARSDVGHMLRHQRHTSAAA